MPLLLARILFNKYQQQKNKAKNQKPKKKPSKLALRTAGPQSGCSAILLVVVFCNESVSWLFLCPSMRAWEILLPKISHPTCM